MKDNLPPLDLSALPQVKRVHHSQFIQVSSRNDFWFSAIELPPSLSINILDLGYWKLGNTLDDNETAPGAVVGLAAADAPVERVRVARDVPARRDGEQEQRDEAAERRQDGQQHAEVAQLWTNGQVRDINQVRHPAWLL